MPPEKTRIYSIDLARGLAVLFMICVHVLCTYSSPEVKHSSFGWLTQFLGGPPAAPVFMALMGVSFYYSRNTDFGAGVKRGFKIILLGYLLNFLRGIVPVFVVSKVAPSMAAGIPPAVMNYTDAFLEIDILQFAGLALIVMAVIRKLQINKYFLLAGAAAVALVSPLLWGKTPAVPVLGHFIDYLWGDIPSSEECIGNLVSFPFFPWFSFVLTGMFLGDTFTKSADLSKTFRKMGIAGVIIMVASLIYLVPHFRYHLNDYYHSRPGIVVFHTGIVLTWLYLCDIAVRKLGMNRAFDILFAWSRHVNHIYIIQWVLIMWGACAVWGFDKSSYGMTIAIMIIMMAASHFTNSLYLRLTVGKKEATSGKQVAIGKSSI